LSLAGQLYFLVDQAGAGPETGAGAAVCVDLEGDRGVLVFTSARAADDCRQRLGKPGVIGTCPNAWEFAAMLESLKEAGAKYVALDYLPPGESGRHTIEAFGIEDFIRELRAAFGIGDTQL